MTDKPVNTLLNTTVVQLTGSNVDFKCSAEAKPPATFSFFGDSLAPVNSVQNGRYTIKLDLTKDGKTLKCVPSNRLGNGPTASFEINVKGILFFFVYWLLTFSNVSTFS